MGSTDTKGKRFESLLPGASISSQSDQKTVVAVVNDLCHRYYDKFVAHTPIDQPIPHGIRRIEAFIFLALCDYFKTQMILESGIFNGKSTRIFARSVPLQKVTSIDVDIKKDVAKELSCFSNLDILQADARTLIPYLLRQASLLRTAVFIDGPKGTTAMRLAVQCFQCYPCVKVIGIHDMRLGQYVTADWMFKAWPVLKFRADNKAFCDEWMPKFHDKLPAAPNSAVFVFRSITT